MLAGGTVGLSSSFTGVACCLLCKQGFTFVSVGNDLHWYRGTVCGYCIIAADSQIVFALQHITSLSRTSALWRAFRLAPGGTLRLGSTRR